MADLMGVVADVADALDGAFRIVGKLENEFHEMQVTKERSKREAIARKEAQLAAQAAQENRNMLRQQDREKEKLLIKLKNLKEKALIASGSFSEEEIPIVLEGYIQGMQDLSVTKVQDCIKSLEKIANKNKLRPRT